MRTLSPSERLTEASLDALRRDGKLRARVHDLARDRPTVDSWRDRRWSEWPPPGPELHAALELQRHQLAAQQAWTRAVVALCVDVGCPSLEAMLFQVEAALEERTPGALRYWGIRAKRGQPGPRRARGQIDSPARLLLARRWHRGKVTWSEVAGLLKAKLTWWIEGGIPAWRDETYPAWREWAGRPRARPIRGAEEIAAALTETEGDSPGRRSPATASGAGDTLRKGVAKIERILAANLPPA